MTIKQFIDSLIKECPSYKNEGNLFIEQSDTSQNTVFKHILLDSLQESKESSSVLYIPYEMSKIDMRNMLLSYINTSIKKYGSQLNIVVKKYDAYTIQINIDHGSPIKNRTMFIYIDHMDKRVQYVMPHNMSQVYFLDYSNLEQSLKLTHDYLRYTTIPTKKILVELNEVNLTEMVSQYNYELIPEHNNTVFSPNIKLENFNNLILSLENNLMSLLEYNMTKNSDNYNSNVLKINKSDSLNRLDFYGQELTIEELVFFSRILIDSLTNKNYNILCCVSPKNKTKTIENLFIFIHNLCNEHNITHVCSVAEELLTLNILNSTSTHHESKIMFIPVDSITDINERLYFYSVNSCYVFYLGGSSNTTITNIDYILKTNPNTVKFMSINYRENSDKHKRLKNEYNLYTLKTNPINSNFDYSNTNNSELLQYQSLGSFNHLKTSIEKSNSNELLLNEYLKLGSPESIKEKLSLFNKLYSILHPKIIGDFKQNKFDCIVDPEQLDFLN